MTGMARSGRRAMAVLAGAVLLGLGLAAGPALAEGCTLENVAGDWTRDGEAQTWTFTATTDMAGEISCAGEDCGQRIYGLPERFDFIGPLLRVAYAEASESYLCKLDGDSLKLGRIMFSR